MATYAKMARLARRRQAELQRDIDRAERQIGAWKGEVQRLDTLVSSLAGMETGGGRVGRPAGRGLAKGRKGGKWRPGHPGRPPKWYVEQQRSAGKGKTAKVAAGGARKKSKRRLSAKRLAGLVKAREALAKKRAAKAAPGAAG